MDSTVAALNWSPAASMLVLGVAVVLASIAWMARRPAGTTLVSRLHALTLVALFLTFDLVLVGAFTRLSDSGLGCPDWPGCYGSASPIGAQQQIDAAQQALPSGPVTQVKAWVEMIHRYFAIAVGALITVMVAGAWLARVRREAAPSPWWAMSTFAWVIGQGAFGALSVTMKLYPAIVTLHLLGGIGLLVLLALQDQAFAPKPLRLSRALSTWTWAVAALLVVQIALGGWVSTNYAVLACREFPLCQGQWWPPMDFAHAFTLQRELGQTAAGAYLPFEALTAIHMTHRLAAALVLAAMLWLAWRLAATGQAPLRRFALGIAALAALQLATGLSNVVLGWPVAAALLHTGGAAALAVLLATLLARAHVRVRAVAQAQAPGWPVYENRQVT
jgi:heme a synthase